MEEEKKEVKETKKNKTVPVLIILVGLILIGGGAAFMLFNKAPEKEKGKEEEKKEVDEYEVEEELLKQLVKVVFISDEDDVTYATPLDDVEGSVAEQDLAKQVQIVVNYAKENNLAKAESDASKCPVGEGNCYSVTADYFGQILRVYGLAEINVNEATALKVSGDKYYFKATDKVVKYNDAMHNYFSMKMMDEIIINDNIHIMNIDPENDTISDKMINKEYLFRKYEDAEDYYLYSIRDNSPTEEY